MYVTFLELDIVQYIGRNLPESKLKCRKYHSEETSGSFDLYLTCFTWSKKTVGYNLEGEEAPSLDAAKGESLDDCKVVGVTAQLGLRGRTFCRIIIL